jgi:hypothetical protein
MTRTGAQSCQPNGKSHHGLETRTSWYFPSPTLTSQGLLPDAEEVRSAPDCNRQSTTASTERQGARDSDDEPRAGRRWCFDRRNAVPPTWLLVNKSCPCVKQRPPERHPHYAHYSKKARKDATHVDQRTFDHWAAGRRRAQSDGAIQPLVPLGGAGGPSQVDPSTKRPYWPGAPRARRLHDTHPRRRWNLSPQLPDKTPRRHGTSVEKVHPAKLLVRGQSVLLSPEAGWSVLDLRKLERASPLSGELRRRFVRPASNFSR